MARWEISRSGNFKACVRQTPDTSDIGIIYHARGRACGLAMPQTLAQSEAGKHGNTTHTHPDHPRVLPGLGDHLTMPMAWPTAVAIPWLGKGEMAVLVVFAIGFTIIGAEECNAQSLLYP